MLPDPPEAFSPQGLQHILVEEIVKQQWLPPHEAAYLVERLMVFFTSCDERRFGQWEDVAWWDFIGAESAPRSTSSVAARGLTRSLVAAKETVASTRTIGNMAEAFVMNIMQRGNDGALDRVLDAPTNEAWIRPWVRMLKRHRRPLPHGPGGRRGSTSTRRGRIAAATVRDRRGRQQPGRGRLVRLRDARRAGAQAAVAQGHRPATRLERIRELYDRLDGRGPVLPAQAGRDHPRPRHVRRRAVGADGAHPGPVLGRARLRRRLRRRQGGGLPLGRHLRLGHAGDPLRQAREALHARRQIKREVWAQIKAHLEDRGDSYLPDGILHSWYLDPGVKLAAASRKRNRNETPLLVNTVGSWEKRPEARTKVPNLFLAGDYVQTDIDLATMEGANETGRAAVAALLERPARRPSRPRCTSSTTRPSSRPPRRSTASCTRRACRTRSTLAERAARARRRGRSSALAAPASATAIALARAGRRVVAIDRARSHRTRSRPTSLGRRRRRAAARSARSSASRRSARRGSPRRSRLVGTRIRGGYTPVDGIDYALCVRRPGLDAALVETARAAGAEVREKCTATGRAAVTRRPRGRGPLPRPDGDEHELRAPLVVGADGRASLVAREVGADATLAVERERPRLLLRLLARRRPELARHRRPVARGRRARSPRSPATTACCSCS